MNTSYEARASARDRRYAKLLARPDLAIAAGHFAVACAKSRKHSRIAALALREYGDRGPLISGCVREHFPDALKDQLRSLARVVTIASDAAYAARPPRVQSRTMRNLARAVATRDGVGFYGPRP